VTVDPAIGARAPVTRPLRALTESVVGGADGSALVVPVSTADPAVPVVRVASRGACADFVHEMSAHTPLVISNTKTALVC